MSAHRYDVSRHGLRRDAIGFRQGLAVALDSTAPAYSLSVVLGIVVAAVGVQAPAVLLLAFVPIVLTALAFAQLNREEPDCGTTFAWVRRAMGPTTGWVAGFVVVTAGVLVIGTLGEVAAQYTFLLLGRDAAGERAAVVGLGVVFVAACTALTVLGTALSARVQQVLVIAQIGCLLLFATVAFARLAGGEGTEWPSVAWLNPFEIPSFAALTAGLLAAVFLYWGWESAVTLNEETREPAVTPGRAATASTVLLVSTYVLVAVAVIGWAGAEGVATSADGPGLLAAVAGDVLGFPLDRLVILAVLTSALAVTQTAMIPPSRTLLSMARAGAVPAVLGRVHPRALTPHVATLTVGAAAVTWYVALTVVSESFLLDTVTALGLLVAFSYSVTGYACVIVHRHRLTTSLRTLLGLGVGPLIGAGLLTWIFVQALVEFADPAGAYGDELLGVGPPLVIGLGLLALGVLLALAGRFLGRSRYFRPSRSSSGRPQADREPGAPARSRA